MANTYQQETMRVPHDESGPDYAAAQAQLCAEVMPVWVRHLATSRLQSEQAVTQMLQAFADINPHINRAELQAQQITEALSQADGGITKLTAALARELAPVRADPQLPATAAYAIDRALGLVQNAVDALEQIAKPFSHETQMVAEQVERMYVAFQFQDRISQMMALLESDIERMCATLHNTAQPPPAVAQWLEQLAAQYAMKEQRQNHDANAAGGGTDNDETTFF
jgi:methyl-accepting chemotaxis protein